MPIFEYQARDEEKGCPHCREKFEVLQRISEQPLKECPHCGAPVRRLISAPNIGESRTGLADRAKSSGFHKFQKLSKGEYEKKF